MSSLKVAAVLRMLSSDSSHVDGPFYFDLRPHRLVTMRVPATLVRKIVVLRCRQTENDCVTFLSTLVREVLSVLYVRI